MLDSHNIPPPVESLRNPEEDFMSLEQMKALIRATLFAGGRIDDFCTVLPIEVKREAYDPEQWLRGPRLESTWRKDILVPNDEHANPWVVSEPDGSRAKERIGWQLGNYLYAALTGHETVDVSGGALFKLRRDCETLEETLAGTSKYDTSLDTTDKLQDAYHIKRIDSVSHDIAETRIYVPVGIEAASLVNSMLDLGAEFSYAKVWVPHNYAGEQRFRRDTPLFEVNNYQQLRSTLGALKKLNSTWKLSERAHHLAGIAVPGLPGVYIGQTESGQSFNSRMEHLFSESILTACREANVPSGTVLGDEWFTTVSEQARLLAMASATELNVNPRSHALLATEDAQKFFEALAV